MVSMILVALHQRMNIDGKWARNRIEMSLDVHSNRFDTIDMLKVDSMMNEIVHDDVSTMLVHSVDM